MDTEMNQVEQTLNNLGFVLDNNQPHIKGERFLMQAVTTVAGQKYILLAQDAAGKRLVIKVAKDKSGQQEIEHERLCRSMINSLSFAYNTFSVPNEVFHNYADGYLINAQEFIDQEISFLERPLTEQFDYALAAFGAQENSRATTGPHLKNIKRIFGLMEATDYLNTFNEFLNVNNNKSILPTLEQAFRELNLHQKFISQYGNFLSHTDFVPHNFRINNGKMYLLDFSAIRFGNKHEGWARFLNFMTLHNPQLEAAFIKYFKDNRAPEEIESLHLMRLFRLGEIITYYQRTLSKSTDNLWQLNNARVEFWHDVLKAELNKETVTEARRKTYISLRDNLRSDAEKERQVGLH